MKFVWKFEYYDGSNVRERLIINANGRKNIGWIRNRSSRAYIVLR